MAERGEDPLHKEKKGLLVAISSSVDKIICHFNTSRNLVQKARLGDSRLSPELGYLILNSLCPSLYALLNNGLKPFQKDVILGRRRLSPWSLVEASVKPGSTKETIHNLFCAVSHLSQLRDPKRRFNAFIFGLLNTKQLDTWISHMNQNYDLFSIFFDPTAFLALASGSNPELCEELLLTLQPLSALTFHLDLLFEHHHLPLPDPSVSPRLVTHGQGDTWGRASLQHIFHWGGQLAHSLVHNAEQKRFPAGRENSQNRSTLHTDISQDQSALSRDSPQDSYSLLSDTRQDSQSSPSDTPQDVPSSNKIKHDSSSPDGENTDGLSPPVSEITQDLSSRTTEIQQNLPCASKEEEHGSSCSPKDNQQDLLVDKKNATQVLSPLSSETAQELISSLSDTIHNILSPHTETPQDSSSRWWGHLAQASRVYMPSSIETFPFTRWSKLRSWGTPEREQEATNVKQEGITGKGETFAITSQNTTKIVDCREEPALDQYIMESSRTFPHTHIGPTQKNAYCTTYSSHIKTAELPQNTEGWGSWFGHLFGANTFPNKEMETKNVKSRRPSSWLQPNINVFDLVKKPLMPERLPLPQKASGDGHQNSSKHERSLRALCDHASSDQTHLSFRRGDILQLLDTVDEDWIRCQRGRDTGLVPVGYTSLIL
ncbi:AP-4 complex accessory subunit RUSC1 [Bombina bombina]|uniref:AP-4 complex accessory subunit RUSC1 n=1 Tax=Bombina bombina TaxID=8345 RepID=UPI00235A6B70|nr:AP-4 complex accessory subunit RUSC1 [Bombina bombina]